LANEPPPPPANRVVSVSAITYTRTGPKGRDLAVTISLVDETNAAVAGASVSATLLREDSPYASGSGTTNQAGSVKLVLRNPPAGCYSTDVTAVTGSNLTFDGTEPINSSCN
jgi:hypothetical protein